MRACFLLLLCLAAGSQASFLDDLKQTFHNIGTALTTTVHAVGDQAKVVGTNLLSAVAEQGKTLASQALQSLLMGTMSSLQKQPTDTDAAKRSLSELLHQSMSLSNAAEKIVDQKIDKMKVLFTESIENLKAISSQIHDFPASDLVKKVNKLVITHHILSDGLQTELVSELTKLYGHALSLHPDQKRGTLTDSLTSVARKLTKFFQPHVQAVQRMTCGMGEETGFLLNTFQTSFHHVNNLLDPTSLSQLQQHGDGTLSALGLTTGTHGTAITAQHGQDALSALKDAVSNILQQTLTNMTLSETDLSGTPQ